MLFKSKDSKKLEDDNGASKATNTQTGESPPAVSEAVAKDDVDARRRAASIRQVHAAFGQIVGLLMRAPNFRSMPLSNLESLLLPALVKGQYLIAEKQQQENGFSVPVAALVWALVSDDIDQKMSQSQGRSINLKATDWRSGENAWITTAIGDKALLAPLIDRLRKTALKGRKVKFFSATPEGARLVSLDADT